MVETGNCPIAESYRAVSHIIPIFAKALQLTPSMKFKCPLIVVVARTVLTRTTTWKMRVIGVLSMVTRVPLGIQGEHAEKKKRKICFKMQYTMHRQMML